MNSHAYIFSGILYGIQIAIILDILTSKGFERKRDFFLCLIPAVPFVYGVMIIVHEVVRIIKYITTGIRKSYKRLR